MVLKIHIDMCKMPELHKMRILSSYLNMFRMSSLKLSLKQPIIKYLNKSLLQESLRQSYFIVL